MLRKTIGEKKLSRNLRRKKPSIGKFPFVMVPSTMRVFKIGKMRLSENLNNIKKHPKNPRRKKLPIITTPFARLRVTMNSLRWMFLLVFIYLTFGIIILFVQQGNEPIRDIVVYSIMGFVTFFMGYFGWRVAQMLREAVINKKPKDDF
jgi:RsiW-degrading membrane proteinase PrsW (M82 family)